MPAPQNERFPFKPGRHVLVANPWDHDRKKSGRVMGMRSHIEVSTGLSVDQYLIAFDHKPSAMWVPTYLVHEFKLTAAEPAQQERPNDQNAT